MHQLLNLNAVSINTNLGCGTLGNLCLTLSPTAYTNLSEKQVVPPPNPGATPVILEGTTTPNAASICCAHNAAMLGFNIFQNVDRALRQQLLGAVEEKNVQVKHRPHRGYSGSSTLDLLTHLYETYAVISNTDWFESDKNFRKACATTDPIVVWRQIDESVTYAGPAPHPTCPSK